jgi:1-acyl-sn-glycerol-3-phosphate acyltransferase
MDAGKWVIMFPEGTRSKRGEQGLYKTGAARLALATGASIVPIAVASARCWPRKSFTFIPGTVAVSLGSPMAGKAGESAGELMERVEDWIESEMRRIDPDAYPEVERPINPHEQEASLQRALEAQADAARAAQGAVPEDVG